MKKAFTLIELTVAVALLVLMVSFSGVIFKVSIKSHRLAMANAEIMTKYRAITDQLNADLKGICKDAPLFIWFQLDLTPDPQDPSKWERFDQIMFFSEGDFQSTRLYDYDETAGKKVPKSTGTRVRGNVARIHYGQAQVCVIAKGQISFVYPWEQGGYHEQERALNINRRTLARRRHILTDNPDLLAWLNPVPEQMARLMTLSFNTAFYDVAHPNGFYPNEHCEHDNISLAMWKALSFGVYSNLPSAYQPFMLQVFFRADYRPEIDLTSSVGTAETTHKLMAEGVGTLSIQWPYWYEGPKKDPKGNVLPVREWRWWPSLDPDGDGAIYDFDFGGGGMRLYKFGIFFNVRGWDDTFFPRWLSVLWRPYTGAKNRHTTLQGKNPQPPGGFPDALKFTFTLYDSKGVIEQGRTFTHIVYLD